MKGRPSKVAVRSILGSLLLVVIAVAQLVLGGDARTVALLLIVGLLIAVLAIASTRRSMRRGKSAEQIIQRWYRLPLVGPLLRFGDRMNSHMGRGSAELLADARARAASTPAETEGLDGGGASPGGRS